MEKQYSIVHTLTAWLLLVLLIIIAVFAWGYYSIVLKPRYQYTPSNPVNNVLSQTNSSFAQAEQLGKQIGITATSSAERVQLYQQALAQATDPIQRGQIEYKIGVSYAQIGDYSDAIATFKDVAANTSYTIYERAYSVQYIADLFYLYHDPQIEQLTFNSPPYNAMVVSGDVALTYRHLYEYASSFYPLDISEARIAGWYADDILNNIQTTGASSSAVQSDLSQVNQHIANAQRDIARTEDDPNARVDIPSALLRIAVVTGVLAEAGLATPADADAAFQTSLQSDNLILGAPDPYYYYHYAAYLDTMYGDSATQEIQSVLSNLYDNSSYTPQTNVMVFLANERMNVTGSKASLVALAAIDPKFKALLLSLGWHTSDFQ